jgi:hypothetical protein
MQRQLHAQTGASGAALRGGRPRRGGSEAVSHGDGLSDKWAQAGRPARPDLAPASHCCRATCAALSAGRTRQSPPIICASAS